MTSKAYRNKIFADGHSIILFFEDCGANMQFDEIAFTFKNPIIENVDIQIEDVPTAFDVGEQQFRIMKTVDSPVRFSINGVCMRKNYNVESSEQGGLIPHLDFLKNVKISDLFLAINKKLSERNKHD